MAAVRLTYTCKALLLSLVFLFSRSAGAISHACQDFDWRDPDGDSCADYAREGWCQAHWAQVPASGISTEVTAKQACCACGGGRDGGQKTSSLIPPPPASAAQGPSSLVLPPTAALIPPPPVQVQPPAPGQLAQQQQLAELPKVTLRPVAAPVPAALHMATQPALAAAPASSPVPAAPCIPVNAMKQKSVADQIAEDDDTRGIPDLRRVMSSVHHKMTRRETQVSQREKDVAEREARVQEREAALQNASAVDHSLDADARKQAEEQLAKVQRLNDKLQKSQVNALARAKTAEQRANASDTKLAEMLRRMQENSEALKTALKEKSIMKEKLDRAEKRLAKSEVEREAALQAAKHAEQKPIALKKDSRRKKQTT